MNVHLIMASKNSNTTGQPLFIVDRDWLRQGSKARKSWTGNVRNRSLYGLAIQVTQQDLPGSSTRRKSHTKAKRRKRERQGEATDSESQGESESSLPQDLPHFPLSKYNTAAAIICNGQNINTTCDPAKVSISTYGSWQANPALHPSISSGSQGFDCVKGLECFLDFYLDVIGTAQHPLETRFRFQSDPSQSVWYPFGYEDDLCLRDTTIFPISYSTNGCEPPAEGASALMCSLLSQLNDRIGKSDLSDNTIAIASCLTLGEHIRANKQLAKVHASGMAEMVRLRGGLHMIDRARRNKIVRADIIHSADLLEPPALPRLPRQPLPPITNSRSPSPELSVLIASLSRVEVSPFLISILWTLAFICEALKSAWKNHTALDIAPYYEHILCLNQDLLTFTSHSTFDEALKLSILNFVQPMFRYCAYTDYSCESRVKALKSSLERLYLEQYDQHITLWIMFVGYMTSQQTSERPWFRRQLIRILQERHISGSLGWHALKIRLEKFLWTDCIHDPIGKQYYEILEHDRTPIRSPRLHSMCITCRGGVHNTSVIPVTSRTMSIYSINSVE